MKKIFLILLFILACTSQGDVEFETSKLLLTRIESYNLNSNEPFQITFFNYDQELKLVSTNDKSGWNTTQYAYEKDKIISIENGETLTKYNYEGELIVSSSLLNKITKILVLTDYKYNLNNQLVNLKNYKNNTLICETSYTYDDQNNVKTEIDPCSRSEKLSFEYDNMKNPYALLYNKGLLKVFKTLNNNITKTYEGDSVLFTMNYVYNEQNYPSSATVSYGVKNVYIYENLNF
jgi:hypothetical protein